MEKTFEKGDVYGFCWVFKHIFSHYTLIYGFCWWILRINCMRMIFRSAEKTFFFSGCRGKVLRTMAEQPSENEMKTCWNERFSLYLKDRRCQNPKGHMSGKQPLMLTHVPDICAEPAFRPFRKAAAYVEQAVKVSRGSLRKTRIFPSASTLGPK